MKKNIIYSTLMFFAMLFVACDIVETKGVYFTEQTSDNNVDTTTLKFDKKVLLIEFTGHKCPNCPAAHAIVKNLQTIYGEKIIPFSIHAGILAKPQGSYSYNFLTPEGTEMFNSFGITGIPTGIINSLDKNNLVSAEAWATQIDNTLLNSPTIGLTLTNSIVDNNIKTEINYTALEDISSNLKLCAYLIEDSIVSKQDSMGIPVLNYLHRHVFRDAFTATVWGDDILTATVLKGDKNTTTLSLPINEVWNLNNCKVITFIYNDQTKEILNAEEKSVK